MKVDEQRSRGGSRCEFVQSHGCSGQVTLEAGRCLLDLVFTHVRDCEICFQCDGFWVVFGMFCLFRAALLSASPRAVYWLGMVLKRKGGFVGWRGHARMVWPSLPPF